MFERGLPVQYVKGVGPRRASLLMGEGVRTAEDLLRYRPFRYEDRANFRRIAELRPDQEAVIQGEIAVTGNYVTPMRKVRIFEMMVQDSSDAIQVKFFNQPYLERVFRRGLQVVLFGVPRIDSYSSSLTLLNPEYEIVAPTAHRHVHTGRIVPIYRRMGELTTRVMRQIMYGLLQTLPEDLEDPLPKLFRDRYAFPDRRRAFQQLHFPELADPIRSGELLVQLNSCRTPAQVRLVFEEFFWFQVGLRVVHQQRALLPKERRIVTGDAVREAVKSVLPFHPTTAQKRVLREIVDDLCSPRIMNRLLQGDVGSGKTIVALQAMVVVAENGFQSALMAPTELLAEQHYRNIVRYLAHTRYQTALLTSSVKGKVRKAALAGIASGDVHLAVGTHALIQGAVEFHNLALAIVDEQHRFGVLQRSQLMQKGQHPDTLVMTATPIPRSLALTLYGDLDVSVLDEIPPGRRPVTTLVKEDQERAEVYELVRHELQAGRQAYIVYPLIEQSEKMDLRAATEMASHLQQDVFPEFVVGLMHGRLKPGPKEELMLRFQRGEVQVLVSTTVIEVGIDVPNATIMVVEHADRFGLSQLHQLRGRIGRGSRASFCILMADTIQSREAFERLEVMRRTSDGFKIAEKDLEIRGPGEFVGTRQSGVPEFRFANLVRDREWLERARADAEEYLRGALHEDTTTQSTLLEQLAEEWKSRYGLYNVG
jgi:ATP-dependent DNA helicase RecG